MGDAAEVGRKRGRKQKTDRQDAQRILGLLLKSDFPPIWVPSWENRDLRNCCGVGTAWCKCTQHSGGRRLYEISHRLESGPRRMMLVLDRPRNYLNHEDEELGRMSVLP